LFSATVQARADDASKLSSERFLDSLEVLPDAECPTTRVVRVDEEHPFGEPLACGARLPHVLSVTHAGLRFTQAPLATRAHP
jgi:hypothetical protein